MRRGGPALSTLAAGVIAIIGLPAIVGSLTDADATWILFSALPGMFGIIVAFSRTRGTHEKLMMPIIAEAFGLDYEKAPKTFYDGLPAVFIPRGGVRKVDDMMAGQIADRRFRFAECKTETGGKNSSTLFKGVVLEVQGKGGVPEFLIASEKETKGFLFFKGRVDVGGMEMAHQSVGSDGKTYGLWARSSETGKMAGLRAFMDQIIALGPKVLGNSPLYSLVSDGRTYFISISHKRDLFKIGGLMANEEAMMRDIRAASAEFALPIGLVTEVLRAEGALLAAS